MSRKTDLLTLSSSHKHITRVSTPRKYTIQLYSIEISHLIVTPIDIQNISPCGARFAPGGGVSRELGKEGVVHAMSHEDLGERVPGGAGDQLGP